MPKCKTRPVEDGVYNSGLNSQDFSALLDVFYPFVLAKNPKRLGIFKRTLPRHLKTHPLLGLLKLYRDTGKKRYLDRAGQLLCPMKEPFGWFIVLNR